jgi:hypothetical protein
VSGRRAILIADQFHFARHHRNFTRRLDPHADASAADVRDHDFNGIANEDCLPFPA